MRRKAKKRLSMCIALVSAISLTATSIAFADGWRVGSVSNGDENADYQVGNYTFLSPGLAGTKMILSDPTLADKSWVEYVEYKLLTEVQEDDIKYYIYQPTDYSVSSIMAIKDYNPDSITGSSTNLSVSLGELSSIFEAASLGTGISSRLLGGSAEANTIASEMTSASDIVKNSKYYSTPSFMGIPGDSEYNGVSNDGYYNASSMTISMTKSSSVQVTKTNTTSANATVGSNESTSTSLSSSTQNSTTRSISNTNSSTKGSSTSIGKTHTDNSSDTHTDNTSDTHTNNISKTHESSKSDSESYSSEKNAEDAIKAIGNIVSFVPMVGSAISGVLNAVAGPIGNALGKTTKGLEFQHGSKDSETDGSSDSHTDGSSDSHTDGSSDSESTTETETLSNSVSNAISDANSYSYSAGSGSSSSFGSSASTSIGYGLNYAQSQQASISETVSRTFSARDDDEVKNVGWKLCQYVVRVPYYIEAVKVNGAEETLIYSQYVTYDLLTGVSRVFANGYIEHWNTGELVPYADFFEGFVTATELVDIAKEQASKVSE